MTRSSAALCVASGLLAAVVVAGCGTEREDEVLPHTPYLSSSTTTSTSAEQEARDNARAQVYEYVSGRNTVLGAPEQYLDTASIGFAENRVARGILAEAGDLRLAKHKLVGAAKLTRDPEPTTVDLEPKPSGGSTVSPYVQVTGCIDESSTHLVDAKGKRVKNSQGPGPHPVRFHVSNRQWPNSTAWRIAWTKDLKGSC